MGILKKITDFGINVLDKFDANKKPHEGLYIHKELEKMRKEQEKKKRREKK